MNNLNRLKRTLIDSLSEYNSMSWKMKKLNNLIIEKPYLKEQIIKSTNFCPINFPISNRYKFIISDIKEMPKCKNCNKNDVSFNFTNYKLLDYCSKTCASSHILTRDKVKKTNKNKFGVEQIMQSIIFQEQYKKTCMEKYGVDNVSKLESIKNKKVETTIKNWGVNNISQNSDIHLLKQKTCFANYGTNYPAQNKEVFKKQESTCGNVILFEETGLTSQGSYELYFLKLMKEKGLISEVFNGNSFCYLLNSKKHIYHSDFYFRNINIEIKSTWFYNKNGKDLNLQEKNESKWSAVRDSGENIVVLMSKKEIKKFVESII